MSARQNVERNGLADRIAMVDVSSSESILQPLEGAFAVPYVLYHDDHECLRDSWHDRFHVTMCNPPFYASMEEVAQSTEAKEYGPSAVKFMAGSRKHMVTFRSRYAQVPRTRW